MNALSLETLANCKAVYSEINGFYLLSLPIAKQVYVFDTKVQLQDGSARVTVWDTLEPTCFLSKRNGDLLFGKIGYIGKYDTYLDNTSTYRLQYFTNYADFGDIGITSILKKILVTDIGGSSQGFTIKWSFDFSGQAFSENIVIPPSTVAQYGVAEYGTNGSPVAYYSNGIQLQVLVSQATGSGKAVQTGYETDINGFAVSIQKIEIQAKRGKLV
jgi:hypothetical protein